MFQESLAEAEAKGGCYEPWQPKIGDRVRIRLNGECMKAHHDHCAAGKVEARTGRPLGHPMFLNGREGTVSGFDPNNRQRGHPYIVHFGARFEWLGESWTAEHFAAIELELIEERSDV